MVFALIFAAMFAGQVASFAPNYIKAKVSAARIFKLLDRVPPIDTYSEDGKKLVNIILACIFLFCTCYSVTFNIECNS